MYENILRDCLHMLLVHVTSVCCHNYQSSSFLITLNQQKYQAANCNFVFVSHHRHFFLYFPPSKPYFSSFFLSPHFLSVGELFHIKSSILSRGNFPFLFLALNLSTFFNLFIYLLISLLFVELDEDKDRI